MKVIKTIRTHSEPINTLLICKNGNLVSGSLGRVIFYSKENLEPILRITEFKSYYISHINETHKDNTFILCHVGLIVIETSNDNKKYRILFSFYERFMMNKSIEFKYNYISKLNKNETEYKILISTVYGINIFEEGKIEIKEKEKEIKKEEPKKFEKFEKKSKILEKGDSNNDITYNFIKKINENELVYNIFQINNNCFVSTSNSVLASGNNCLRFWSYPEMINIKTLNNVFCSSGVYSIIKLNEKILLVGLEKISSFLIRNVNKTNQNHNINGIAVIDLEYFEIVQYIETHNCIRSLLLTSDNNIIAGSSFKLIQYKFNNGMIEKISEKELYNYINNTIVEINKNTFATGSNNRLIIVIKKMFDFL